MNKLELIQELKNQTGITKEEAKEVVNTFFNAMTQALAQGERVEIRGLFSFYVKCYKGYEGRNPKTGVKVTIQPKKMPFFKCGEGLKRLIDE